MYCFTSLAAEC